MLSLDPFDRLNRKEEIEVKLIRSIGLIPSEMNWYTISIFRVVRFFVERRRIVNNSKLKSPRFSSKRIRSKSLYLYNLRSHRTDDTGICRINIKIADENFGNFRDSRLETRSPAIPREILPWWNRPAYYLYDIARGLERIANPGENSKNEERQPMRKRIDTVGRRKGRALFTSACVPDAPKPRGSYLSRRRSYFIRGQILITHRVPTPTFPNAFLEIGSPFVILE